MSLGFTKMRCRRCGKEWITQWGVVGMVNMAAGSVDCPACRASDVEGTLLTGGLGDISTSSYTPFSVADEILREKIWAERLEIKVKRLTPTAILPTKAYEGDLGWDLYADENPHDKNLSWIVPPGGVCVIPTGCAFQLPAGWGAYNRPRSSQGISNLDIYGGVIDNGYRGELKVTVHNSNSTAEAYAPGQRVGQLVLTPCPLTVLVEVNYLDPSERGEKRFGSSGR